MSRGPAPGDGPLNAQWSALIVEELFRLGVTDFCIAPGSRSTPLTLAAARHSGIARTVHFDERGCGFHALGLARGRGRPAAVICTSGTAAANLYPAVVEAAMDGVPLVLLTADRPPELQDAGANQTIHQRRLFGDYVRWEMDLPAPTTTFPAASLLTTIDQAVQRSRGRPPGPVHINTPFREPLAGAPATGGTDPWQEPIRCWQESSHPYTRYHHVAGGGRLGGDHPVAEALRVARRGLLVVGRLKTATETAAAAELARRLGWPAVADIGSGLRLGHPDAPWLHHVDLLLDALGGLPESPDTVLHVGGGLVSKRLQEYLQRAPLHDYIHVTEDPRRLDPGHHVSQRLDMSLRAFVTAAAALEMKASAPGWSAGIHDAGRHLRGALDADMGSRGDLDEPAVNRLVSRLIPADSALFLASSMPIRDMDCFADPAGAPVAVGCNRGASGIDGTIATACGFATGLGRRVTVVCGDLALLHDLNSLALVRTCEPAVTVVVINNDGGGIFSFLPVAAAKTHFEPYFATPHGLGFEQSARAFDLAYRRPTGISDFTAAYGEAAHGSRPTLIEVRTERGANLRRHREIVRAVGRGLAGPAI